MTPQTVTRVTYAVLFVLGLLEGMIGSFQYSQGPAPLLAIILDVAIFATCVLGAWGTRAFGGGLSPAVGWLIASFVLSAGSSHGTVIITATTAGEWYLFGGALAALAGVFTARVTTPAAPLR